MPQTLTRVEIDFPQANETMLGETYTFRISAPADQAVHVSIDGGEWLACRSAVGFWWFDWTCQTGKHTLKARVVDAVGDETVSPARRFQVGQDTTFAPLKKAAARVRKAVETVKIGSVKKAPAKKKSKAEAA